MQESYRVCINDANTLAKKIRGTIHDIDKIKDVYSKQLLAERDDEELMDMYYIHKKVKEVCNNHVKVIY